MPGLKALEFRERISFTASRLGAAPVRKRASRKGLRTEGFVFHGLTVRYKDRDVRHPHREEELQKRPREAKVYVWPRWHCKPGEEGRLTRPVRLGKIGLFLKKELSCNLAVRHVLKS